MIHGQNSSTKFYKQKYEYIPPYFSPAWAWASSEESQKPYNLTSSSGKNEIHLETWILLHEKSSRNEIHLNEADKFAFLSDLLIHDEWIKPIS